MIVGVPIEFGEASEGTRERGIKRRVCEGWWVSIGEVVGNIRAVRSWRNGKLALEE